ncbi:MAG: hypothetical protein KAZ71_06175 [Bacteroidia bacterium]|nr:hypothetical protein [Bacteroidia bacterium]
MSSKIYKSKNDIPFVKFNQFVQAIEGMEDNGEYVATQIKEIFETEDFEAFDKAIKTNGLINIPYKIDLEFQNAEKWIDCDTLTSESETIEFLKIVLKPKHWWSRKINFDKISLELAEYVTRLFTNGQPI